MTQAETNALQIEIRNLQAKVNKMRELSTTANFFKYYFTQLQQHKSNSSCFDCVNEEYYELFGRYRYSDYAAFRVAMNYYNQKNKIKS